MRVLLLAEACNPEQVSVPLVGYSHCMAIRRQQGVEAKLVTQIRNRDALTRAGLKEDQDFVCIDTERIAAPAHRLATRLRGGSGKGWTTVMAIRSMTYPFFERQVWKQFKASFQSGRYDAVHRVTPLSPTTPSILAKRLSRLKIPLIIGPLNGGVPWPKQFDAIRRQEKEWLSYVRSAYRLLPGYNSTRNHASAILVGSRDTMHQIPERYRHKCIYLPENGIDPNRFTARREREANGPLRLIFVGRLVPYKGADMLIQAAADILRSDAARLEVIGDGPERSNLQVLAKRLGVTDQVTFRGNIEHADVQHRMADSDLLVFPSIREFGGAVALEAMAVGLVPMVVSYGGLAELVTDETGFRIPIGRRDEIVRNLRHMLVQLVADPSPIEARSRIVRAMVDRSFTWDAKAKQVMEVYRRVCSMNSNSADTCSQQISEEHPRQLLAR
ncbi:MAG: glycosyltransferase [Planctomycetota bacterium]